MTTPPVDPLDVAALVLFTSAITSARRAVQRLGLDSATCAAALQVAAQVDYARLSDEDKELVRWMSDKFTEEIQKQVAAAKQPGAAAPTTNAAPGEET